MKQAILFDFGGTLDLNGEHWFNRFFRAYEEAGMGLTRERLREAYISGERYVERLGPVDRQTGLLPLIIRRVTAQGNYLASHNYLGDELRTVEKKNEISLLIYNDILRNVEENKPLLIALKERFRLALVSNFYGNLATVVEELGLKDLFETVVDSAVVRIRKPDKRIFECALSAMGLQAKDAYVVGDSVKNDILPALSLGCTAVWLRNSGFSGNESAPESAIVIEKLSELNRVCQ